jgi:hypothetical protein
MERAGMEAYRQGPSGKREEKREREDMHKQGHVEWSGEVSPNTHHRESKKRCVDLLAILLQGFDFFIMPHLSDDVHLPDCEFELAHFPDCDCAQRLDWDCAHLPDWEWAR